MRAALRPRGLPLPIVECCWLVLERWDGLEGMEWDGMGGIYLMGLVVVCGEVDEVVDVD